MDYRTAARRCELCGAEMEAHELQDLVGLACCAPCSGGDLDRAAQHWGFVLKHRFTEGGHGSSDRFFIEVKRPTFVEAFAKFDADSGPRRGWLTRLFRQADPEVGDRAFDDQVLVKPDPGAHEATMSLLQHSGVRRAVQELVQQGAEVDLTGNSVWVHDMDQGALGKMAVMELALPYAVALAVHIERIAREG